MTCFFWGRVFGEGLVFYGGIFTGLSMGLGVYLFVTGPFLDLPKGLRISSLFLMFLAS